MYRFLNCSCGHEKLVMKGSLSRQLHLVEIPEDLSQLGRRQDKFLLSEAVNKENLSSFVLAVFHDKEHT